MEQPTIKQVALNRNEWILAYTIIRVTEAVDPFVEKIHPVHLSLSQKVEQARYNPSENGITSQTFTEQERIYMRSYKITYCANLADNMKTLPASLLKPFQELEIMSLYKMANKVQLAFSSI